MTLKEFRSARKMSVKELATALGLHWVTVHKYENGTRKPNLKAIDKIRRYTGGLVDISDFLNQATSSKTL